MADEAKTVVDSVAAVKAAPVIPAAAPSVPQKKTFRFFKSVSPRTPVRIPGCKGITFTHTRTQKGGWASVSNFETGNETLAALLRGASDQHVFEIK